MDNKVNAASGAASLPQALTALILQLVPQQQRLSQCALACKAWAAAAAAATVHVEYSPETATLPVFERWVNQHTAQILSLRVLTSEKHDHHKLLLPLNSLEQLQLLHLKGIILQNSDDTPSAEANSGRSRSSSSSGDSMEGDSPVDEGGQEATAVPLSRLQQLHLEDVKLPTVGSLLLLTQSQALLSVRLQEIIFAGPPTAGSLHGHTLDGEAIREQMVQVISRMLQQLPRRLKVLEVPEFLIPSCGMQRLAAMQELQELSLSHMAPMPMCDVSLLPSSITQLHFDGRDNKRESSALPSELQQLAGLLQLKLSSCAVPPGVLRSFPHLQKLHMERCTLLPVHDPENPGRFDIEGTAALLDALQHLTSLQHLQLNLDRLDTRTTPPHLFAALTASNHLTELILEPDSCIPLPKGAAQHMFGLGKHLPLLRCLWISNSDDSEHPNGWPDDLWSLDGCDLSLMTSCCPGLQQLDIALNVDPDADLEGLLQLPRSCTSLTVGGKVFDDGAARGVVAQLTQLRNLCWNKSPNFTDAGLEMLASLPLRRLYIYDCALTDDISIEGEVDLEWSPYKGSVSRQIDALCDLSPVCAPGRLRQQRAAAAAAAVRERVLQQENARLRAQLARRDEQLRLLQRQLEAAGLGQQQ